MQCGMWQCSKLRCCGSNIILIHTIIIVLCVLYKIMHVHEFMYDRDCACTSSIILTAMFITCTVFIVTMDCDTMVQLLYRELKRACSISDIIATQLPITTISFNVICLHVSLLGNHSRTTSSCMFQMIHLIQVCMILLYYD